MRNREIVKIAANNIKYWGFRSIMMIFFIFMLAFTMTIFSSISSSSENGLKSLNKRLGADILVVPASYEGEVENALFKGIPSTVYFDDSWVDKIKRVEGVEKVSTQLFIATLNSADCCQGKPVQIIGFDPETDFLIQPWLAENHFSGLNNGEIYVGNSITYDPGDSITYFGTELKVAGKLEKTGMGYDNSIFMKTSDSHVLMDSPAGKKQLSFMSKKQISMIVINVRSDAEVEAVRQQIEDSGDNDEIRAFTLDDFTQSISESINQFTNIGSVTTVLNILTSIVAIICLFSITINERKNEFGILFSLGGDKTLIISMIFIEAAMISLIGTVIGIFFSYVGLFLFGNLIHQVMELPLLDIKLNQHLGNLLTVVLVALGPGVISAIISTARVLSVEPGDLVKESN